MPASTIRRLRVFHGWSREHLAETFRIDIRTVYRWEYYGVRIDNIKLDPGAHPDSGPDWRRKLLVFMLERYESTAVSDTRKQEAP